MNNQDTMALLGKEIVNYIHSRRDKKLEAFFKDKPKKNKQGDVVNGAINAQLIQLAKDAACDNCLLYTSPNPRVRG